MGASQNSIKWTTSTLPLSLVLCTACSATLAIWTTLSHVPSNAATKQHGLLLNISKASHIYCRVCACVIDVEAMGHRRDNIIYAVWKPVRLGYEMAYSGCINQKYHFTSEIIHLPLSLFACWTFSKDYFPIRHGCCANEERRVKRAFLHTDTHAVETLRELCHCTVDFIVLNIQLDFNSCAPTESLFFSSNPGFIGLAKIRWMKMCTFRIVLKVISIQHEMEMIYALCKLKMIHPAAHGVRERQRQSEW